MAKKETTQVIKPEIKKQHQEAIVYHESGRVYDMTVATDEELANLASQDNWKYLFIDKI